MKTINKLILLLAVPVLVAADPVKLEVAGIEGVVARVGEVFVAGQPDREALAWAKGEGVGVVVNLRTPAEMQDREVVPFDERAAAADLGLRYVEIPLGGDEGYSPEAVARFAEVLHAADGRLLLHCASGRRASHLWAAYLYRYRGLSLEQAIDQAAAINFGSLPLEGLLGKKLGYEIRD